MDNRQLSMYSTGSRGLFEPTALDSFIEQNSPFKQSQPPWEVDRNDRSNFMSPVHDFGKKGQSFDSWQEQQASQLARKAGSFDIHDNKGFTQALIYSDVPVYKTALISPDVGTKQSVGMDFGKKDFVPRQFCNGFIDEKGGNAALICSDDQGRRQILANIRDNSLDSVGIKVEGVGVQHHLPSTQTKLSADLNDATKVNLDFDKNGPNNIGIQIDEQMCSVAANFWKDHVNMIVSKQITDDTSISVKGGIDENIGPNVGVELAKKLSNGLGSIGASVDVSEDKTFIGAFLQLFFPK